MQGQLNQHPASLKTFFITEMWERYGFYVVQSLLALFLALYFKWPDKKVYFLVSSFTALNYLTPVIGGWIADYLLGQKNSILMGAVILLLSYVALAMMRNDAGLTLALAAIPVGTGLLKPNISSLLGNEYPESSSKRDSGFTIFYMGLAGGIILGTTLPSMLNAKFGWSVSFASASIGMLVSIMVFWHGIKCYNIKDYHPSTLEFSKLMRAIFASIGLWAICFNILNHPQLADIFISVIGLLSIAYFVYNVRKEPKLQSKRTFVVGLLCLISVLFWAFYFQMFMSLTLFIVRMVDPLLWGIKFYPPYYISVQSIGLILFGFYFSQKKHQVSIEQSGVMAANKFLVAVVCIWMAYAAIAVICHLDTSVELYSPLLFIPVYLMISLAEILLSPVGLSAVSLLANSKKVSTMVGMFFVTLGIGAFLSGKLADLTAIPEGETSLLVLRAHYAKVFTQQSHILFISTIACFAINRLIKRLLNR